MMCTMVRFTSWELELCFIWRPRYTTRPSVPELFQRGERKKKYVKISLQDVYTIMCFVSSSEPVEVRVLQEEFWSWPLTPVFWTWPAVTSDLNLVSPDYFEPLWNFWPHLKQLVAVRTHSLLMSDPPQRWYPNLCRLTCHGQLPGLALSPPTILVLSGGRPHTGRK